MRTTPVLVLVLLVETCGPTTGRVAFSTPPSGVVAPSVPREGSEWTAHEQLPHAVGPEETVEPCGGFESVPLLENDVVLRRLHVRGLRGMLNASAGFIREEDVFGLTDGYFVQLEERLFVISSGEALARVEAPEPDERLRELYREVLGIAPTGSVVRPVNSELPTIEVLPARMPVEEGTDSRPSILTNGIPDFFGVYGSTEPRGLEGTGPLVLATYSVTPDGTVVRVEFYVTPDAYGPGCHTVARRMMQSALPVVEPSPWDLGEGDVSPESYFFRFVVPPGYVATERALPHNGNAYRVQRLRSLAEPQANLTLYVGQYGDYSPVRMPRGSVGDAATERGTLFGLETEWTSWSETWRSVTTYYRAATVRGVGPSRAMVQVGMEATDDALFSELLEVLESVKLPY